MAEFLSPAWLVDLDAAAHVQPSLLECARGGRLVVEQRVHDAPGGTVTYHLLLDEEGAHVIAGAAPAPDVVLLTDYEQAVRLHRGLDTAEDALAAGRLKLRGDLTVLLDREATLRGLDDTFAAVRAGTTFPVLP